MIWSIAPVQMTGGKKGGGRQYAAGQKAVPDGFLSVLEELNGTSRQDGFSARKTPRQQEKREGEMDFLQRRIQHVNRLLLSFMTAQN